MSADDKQIDGNHYNKLKVQPWSFMESFMSPEEFEGYLMGNIIKYVARDKGSDIEDMKKAIHYAEKWVEFREERRKKEKKEAINSLKALRGSVSEIDQPSAITTTLYEERFDVEDGQFVRSEN